jgi:putative flippase GtrA
MCRPETDNSSSNLSDSGLHKFIKEILVEKTNLLQVQLFRYLIVGGLAFVVDFIVLFLLVNYLSVNYLVAAGISFLLGLLANYLLSISWVFNQEAKSSISQSVLIFVVTGVVGLGINEVFMYTFTHLVGLQYLLSKIFTVPIVLLWNFLSRRYLLNRSEHDRE